MSNSTLTVRLATPHGRIFCSLSYLSLFPASRNVTDHGHETSWSVVVHIELARLNFWLVLPMSCHDRIAMKPGFRTPPRALLGSSSLTGFGWISLAGPCAGAQPGVAFNRSGDGYGVASKKPENFSSQIAASDPPALARGRGGSQGVTVAACSGGCRGV